MKLVAGTLAWAAPVGILMLAGFALLYVETFPGVITLLAAGILYFVMQFRSGQEETSPQYALKPVRISLVLFLFAYLLSVGIILYATSASGASVDADRLIENTGFSFAPWFTIVGFVLLLYLGFRSAAGADVVFDRFTYGFFLVANVIVALSLLWFHASSGGGWNGVGYSLFFLAAMYGSIIILCAQGLTTQPKRRSSLTAFILSLLLFLLSLFVALLSGL